MIVNEQVSFIRVISDMSSRFFIAVLCLFVFGVSVCTAIDNPSVRGSAIVPPSSFQSGLYRSPNPIDTSTNLVITGNVGAGRHFRGVVPYQSVTEFGADVPSSSLDSFLRRSADSHEFGRYTGTPLPYYSISKTVSMTRPGDSVVFRPPTSQTRIETGSSLPVMLRSGREDFAEWPVELGRQLPSTKLRPMSKTPQEMQTRVLSEVEKYIKQAGLQAVRPERTEEEHLESDQDKTEQIEDGPGPKADTLALATPEELKLELGIKADPKRQKAGAWETSELQKQKGRPAESEQLEGDLPLDVYEQMKQQIDGLLENLQEQQALEEDPESKAEDSEGEAGEEKSEADKFAELSLAAAKAEAILAEHKTFASYTEDNFNKYLRAGEKYLKEGRYYLAADAFTMALLYKPDDPLAYAGKSHALFAAGEYMSSALFLARALEIFPEYALFKIDIEAMIGDRDRVETRMADVEDWVKISRAGELEFLLGYVYYQMGRLNKARESIDVAYENMPDSSAVAALRKVIYDRTK